MRKPLLLFSVVSAFLAAEKRVIEPMAHNYPINTAVFFPADDNYTRTGIIADHHFKNIKTG